MDLIGKGGIFMNQSNVNMDQAKENMKWLKLMVLSIVLLVVSFTCLHHMNLTFEKRVQKIVGKNNVQNVKYFEKLETMPSLVTMNIAVRPIYDEKHYVQKFSKYAAEICQASENHPEIDQIKIVGFIETLDTKGNVSLTKYITFTSEKSQRKDVNWEKFKEMVIVDHKTIENIGKLSK